MPWVFALEDGLAAEGEFLSVCQAILFCPEQKYRKRGRDRPMRLTRISKAVRKC
jgi:hypothetical protein